MEPAGITQLRRIMERSGTVDRQSYESPELIIQPLQGKAVLTDSIDLPIDEF